MFKSKIEFKTLSCLATKESHFVFKRKLYNQVDRVAMDSTLGLIFAFAFLLYFEKNCWKIVHLPLSLITKSAVDDNAVLFVSPKHLPLLVYTNFENFLSSNYKFGALYKLSYRCIRICSGWTNLHTELLFL